MDKQNVVYPYNEMPISNNTHTHTHTHTQTEDTDNNMRDSQNHYAN